MPNLYESGGTAPLPPHLQDSQHKCLNCGTVYVGSTISPCPACSKDAESHTPSLPEGKTCLQCVNYRNCVALFGCYCGNTVCDWTPSRFKDAEPAKRSGIQNFYP